MDRRDFLRTLVTRTGIGAGVALAGAAGYLGYHQPRREFYVDPFAVGGEDLPERLEIPEKAVVVGGGLAGMAAAMELARRNFEVTLLEASDDPGGKLTGWEVDALGERFPVEHGFHGYFDQYYNLNELFEAAGVGDVFTPAPGYPVKFRERPLEVFGQAPKLFPLNILSVVQQSDSLDMLPILMNFKGMLPVMDMFRYEYGKTFSRYDNIDFMTFCREQGVYDPFLATVLHPFSDATMNRMEVLSAAEALRYFHFYFFGSPEALGYRITKQDCMTALVTPVMRMLEDMGVNVVTGARVSRLVAEGDRVRGVVTGIAGGQEVMRVPYSSVREGEWYAATSPEGVPVLVTLRTGEYVAFDATCTHMGCPVHPVDGGGFFCPCHAGVFDSEGNVVEGPPETPLAKLDVTLSGDQLVLRRSVAGEGEKMLECDYCVLASNVRGTREIIGRSALGRPEFEQRIAALGEADPYIVWRLWLDAPVSSADYPFYTVSGYTYTDSVSIFSRFQEPFISWSARTGGSVVELHAYAIAPEDIRPEAEIREVMLEEMHRMFPETRTASVLYDVFMQQDNFTRWAPGDHGNRPETETPFRNLMLAGDWVKVDAPVFLMEAAVFTGRLAVNAISRQESLRSTPLPIVSMEGMFA